MRSPVFRVLQVAVASRVLVLLLALLSDAAVQDYDTSARYDVPNTSTRCELSDGDEKTPQKEPLAQALCQVLEDKLAWDSVHYLRIAQCGYETEKSHAFFPLLPALMRALQATLLRSLLPQLYPRCTLALAGFLLSNACFVLAALALYWLGCIVLRDGQQAARAAFLFCLNPAGVFYSALYTESLFAFLTFAGALSLAVDSPWRAALAFFAASATRSNGVANCLLLAWHSARRVGEMSRAEGKRAPWGPIVLEALACAARCAFVIAPFVLFQLWAWLRFCVGTTRPWCTRMHPSIYSFVQAHYWGLGLFKYYRWEQLPNFALAAPVLAFTWCGVAAYVRADPRRARTLGLLPPPSRSERLKPAELAALERQTPEAAARQRRLVEEGELVPFGFAATQPPPGCPSRAPSVPDASTAGAVRRRGGAGAANAAETEPTAGAASEAVADEDDDNDDAVLAALLPPPIYPAVVLNRSAGAGASLLREAARREGGGPHEWGYLGSRALPHVALWALLAVPALLVMHVQVATRLLSACPALYWYGAHLSGTHRLAGRLVWLWFISYTLVGTVLFVNFYPWT